MLLRNCAGGVVFYEDKVFILKNEKDEWILPKGKIQSGNLAIETAKIKVKEETGLENIQIVSPAGETNYEFYSLSRKKPVCNEIIWFIMEAKSLEYDIKSKEFKNGGFYEIQEAIEKITYSQDKSLVRLSHKKYLKLKNENLAIV
ncbi:NUDIX domain-containing protein [Senegalia massiliensis]|uniref:NUDIX domain-containing protein n=2 Tax=Senegalia massiliensis TaxID=1720316 RepID=A0A845R0G8_9CLOT|nr:NUDIX domain-containing protein [Senegalia massiliensis]NBI06958.1 NUDIX domain-containing protein [Senegalia massiliensis]